MMLEDLLTKQGYQLERYSGTNQKLLAAPFG